MKPISLPFVLASVLFLVGCAADPHRPAFSLASDEAFDVAGIQAYADDHRDIYRHIDTNIETHLGELQRWVRQRSISAQDDGVDAMAEMLRADLEGIGFTETRLVETPGHPGVWGYYDAGAETTLLVYMMYDVQPVEDNWSIDDPFAGTLVEDGRGTVLMARGATNQKGPQRALLNALQSIIAVRGDLPVNVMVLAEGEEELGSPNYPLLVSRFESRLRGADGVFFPMNLQDAEGRLTLNLGVKGILYFELEAQGGDWGGPSQFEIHGSYKALVDSPTWRLVNGLSSLVSDDGNTIVVPDYYEGIRPPTVEESRLVNGLAESQPDPGAAMQAMGISRFIDDVTGRDALLELYYQPTLNIDGLVSGYTGEGVKTILPHRALAKVDSRLPYGLDPDVQLEKIRRHLDAEGFGELEIRKLSAYPASQTSVEADIVQAALSVFAKYGEITGVAPRLAGSAPFYQFTERLDLPMVFGGVGNGGRAHAPDEYMVIYPAAGSAVAGLADIEKSYVDMLFAFAKMKAGNQR
ncbi:MAG: M20/M25/M40 family metallo-hydrolase [Gammaproteobacteria bacterium]|nr:M20/M25/M40 family metallo-hydrolase [Gammaproteobacteria bacterium]